MLFDYHPKEVQNFDLLDPRSRPQKWEKLFGAWQRVHPCRYPRGARHHNPPLRATVTTTSLVPSCRSFSRARPSRVSRRRVKCVDDGGCRRILTWKTGWFKSRLCQKESAKEPSLCGCERGSNNSGFWRYFVYPGTEWQIVKNTPEIREKN